MKFLRIVRFIIPGLKVAGIFLAISTISLNASCAGLRSADGLVERLDRNGDGGLSLSEVPQQMKRLHNAFDIIDANGDGIISSDEFSAISARRQSGGKASSARRTQLQDNKSVVTPAAIVGKGANAIHARMQQAISSKELPGAVVMFIKDGRVVFEKVYGYADIESGRQQQLDDLFNLGSTSKPLAMTTIMTQVDDGKIALDDAMSRWDSHYVNKKLVDGSQAKRSPTVREMMSHTSGTFSVKCGKRRDLSLLYMFGHTLEESAEEIAEKPLVYQPGEGFCYGGPAMQVLAHAVEVITDVPFDDLARKEVFTPLGMKDTFYRTSEDFGDRISVIYDRVGDNLKRSRRTRNPRGNPFILVPGGVFSTGKDLSRFVQAHLEGGVLNGKRVLPEKLVREMRRNQIGNNKMDFGDPSVGDRNSAALGKIEGYGLGWILDEIDADGNARVFSHGGAWGTYIWGDVEAQLGAILLTQTPLTYATPVWNDVLSIARTTWSGAAQPKNKSDVWTANDRQIGKPGLQYIDPEILDAEALMTFQDQSGDVWVSRIDPASGLFTSVDGRDILMSKGALSVRQSYNGPEFGLDKNGWAVFFTREINDVPQVWRSWLKNGQPQAQPLLSDNQRRQTVLASKNAHAQKTNVLYVQGKLGSGRFFWSKANRPADENGVVRLKEVDSPRWIDNTNQFVFVESDGKDAGQIKLVDTEAGNTSIITNDAGVKSFAYGWKAPEFGNEMLVLALIDYTAVGVWRNTTRGYWQRIATLTPPKSSRYKYFGSPEPFVSQGKSYVSLVLKDSNTRGRFRDSEVWILAVDANQDKRFSRRVDDGRTPVMRSDPEVYTGESDIYVYYNAVDEDKVYEIHRASTGLLSTKAESWKVGAAFNKSDHGQMFDCVDSASCAAIKINGAPAATMRDGSLSAFRGMVDASIIADPQSGDIYLAYTSVSSHDPAASTGPRKDIEAGIALARSADSGKTWMYDTALKPSISEKDPVSGRPGYASQEVASLARGGGYWYLAYLRFHDPAGGGNNRKRDSFHLEVSRARSPDALASAKVVKLAGALASDSWSDYQLSKLSSDLSGCSLWLDPELRFQNERLYLMAVCIPYEAGTRRSEKSFYAVFELGNDAENFAMPRYLGKLGDGNDASRLGANELSKGDLAMSRDGALLFLVAPVFKGARFEEYTGCYVFEVESLDPPRLKRDIKGNPVARVVVRSSDSIPTAASCAYDPASEAGIILTRREMLPAQRKLVWSLHATGVHP